MINIKVPGKLMIAGEYAVLEKNQKCIVAAINRYVEGSIEPSIKNQLFLPDLKLEDIFFEIKNRNVEFSIEDFRLSFLRNSISVVVRFLKENSIDIIPFKLSIKSHLDDASSGKKYGLGSSAAIVVATVSSILALHNKDEFLNYDTIFKLSAIAHLKTQGNGSGADIAAGVYGGWLEYSAFDSKWLLNELESSDKIKDILEKPWRNLIIRKLTPPSELKLAVGWTKETASTSPMIRKVDNFKKENPNIYKEFLKESSIAVDNLIKAFNDNNFEDSISALSENRKTLKNFGEKACIPIETKKLTDLCSIGERYGSAKSSGAGGGDCGIAFLKGDYKKQELYREWEKADIEALDLEVSETGVYIKDIT